MLIDIEIFRKIFPIYSQRAPMFACRRANLLGDAHQSMTVHGKLHRINVLEVIQIDFLLYDLLFDQINDDVLWQGCCLLLSLVE